MTQRSTSVERFLHLDFFTPDFFTGNFHTGYLRNRNLADFKSARLSLGCFFILFWRMKSTGDEIPEAVRVLKRLKIGIIHRMGEAVIAHFDGFFQAVHGFIRLIRQSESAGQIVVGR